LERLVKKFKKKKSVKNPFALAKAIINKRKKIEANEPKKRKGKSRKRETSGMFENLFG